MDLSKLRQALSLDHRSLAGLAYLADGALLLVRVAGRWTLPGWATYSRRTLQAVQAAVRQQLGDPPGRIGRTISSRTFGHHVIYVIELPPPSRLWQPKLATGTETSLWVRPGDLKTADVDPLVARILNTPSFWRSPGTLTTSPNLLPGFEVNYQRAKQSKPYETNFLPPGATL